MPTCGYVCPSCEGKGIDDEGNNCTWCNQENIPNPKDTDSENQLIGSNAQEKNKKIYPKKALINNHK